MIDRVSFYVPGRHKIDGVNYTTPGLEWAGVKGQIRLKQYRDGLYVAVSLPKLLNGHNLITLDRKGVKEAVLKLRDSLDLDIRQAAVNSVETGPTVIVKENPENYLMLFGHKPGYKRHEVWDGYFESLTYLSRKQKGNFAFKVYDKTVEMADKKKPVPALFQNQNVIRLEHKILHRQGIQRRLGEDISPHALYDYGVYEELKSLFYRFYQLIPKHGRDVFWNMELPMTYKKFITFLAENSRQGHHAECDQFLARARLSGVMPEKEYKRCRAWLKQVNVSGRNSFANELISELDAHVHSYVKTG